MSKKKGFILYLDQEDLFDSLTDENAGKLIKAVFAYQSSGELPNLEPASRMLFMVICNQLDRDNEKWARTVERRAEAGRAGGRARAEGSKQMLANASKPKQTKQMLANQADRDSDKERDNDSDSESERESDRESAGEPRAEGAPPAPDPAPAPAPNTIKKPRGQFGMVMLSDRELDRLKDMRPDDWEDKVAYLDGYLARTGKQYEDHFLTIITWAEEDDMRAPKPETSVHFENEKVNKGQGHGDIFLDIYSEAAEEYIRGGELKT